MKTGIYKRVSLILAAAALMVVYGAAEAHAGWGSWGSRGGSWGSSGGSWGSSGGSWGSRGGSWGSRGGSWGSRGGSWGSHGSSGGSWGSRGGSWGSSGGSWGSRGGSWGGSSGGSWGSRGGSWGGSSGGSWGSSGGGYYSGYHGHHHHGVVYSHSGGIVTGGVVQGQVMQQGGVYTTTPAPSTTMQPSIQVQPGVQYSTPEQGQPVPGGRIQGGSTPPPSPNTATETLPETLPVSGDTAILNLRVPTDAVVYVNGKRTSTPGEFRSYVSRNLEAGKNYSYEVRAEVERLGETITRTKVVELAAGVNKTFELDFDQAAETITSVTLFVPEDAVVTLGGVETGATGPMRYFSTNTLEPGDQWKAYQVSVTVERDGEQITRKRYVDVNAGDSVNLRFDFDTGEQVASR